MKVRFVPFQLPLLIEVVLQHPKVLQGRSDVCITKTEVAKYGVSHVPVDRVANVQLHSVIGSNVKGGEVGVIGPCNITPSVSRSMDSKNIRVSGKGCRNEVETTIGIFDDNCGISLLVTTSIFCHPQRRSVFKCGVGVKGVCFVICDDL